MTINTRIWENSIAGLPKGDPQAEQFEHYAREFFIPDYIAPAVYLANVAALMDQTVEEGGAQPTASAARMALSTQRPTGFPTWFVAAYPDVAAWFDALEGSERTSVDAEVTRRSTATGTATSHLVDENGFFAHAVLRALIDLYHEHAGVALECLASAADMQEEGTDTTEEEQALTAQQAVDLMATNISRYERELAINYGDRFADLQSRLVVAGLLQLGYYILVDQVMPLATLAQAAVESMSADDPVVEFVERLETEVFCIEGGESERPRVTEACHLLRSRILDMVLLARSAFQETPTVTRATSNFMEAKEFEPLRKAIGILPDR
ncbi:MAG: hypothetical protein ACYDHF_05600 [Candidatus Cryosericum sp.]